MCCCWTAFFNSVLQMLPFLAVFGVVGNYFKLSRTATPKPIEEVTAPCCGDVH